METKEYCLKQVFKIRCIFSIFLLFSLSPVSAQNIIHAAVPAESTDSVQSLILHKIANTLNCELEIKEEPFARRLQNMKSGNIDMTGGLLKNTEREKFIHYIPVPYKLKSNKIFIVKKGNISQIQKYEDLYKLRIGTNIKSTYFSRFDKDPEIIKEAVPAFEQNILKLLANRLDAVIYTEEFALLKIDKMGLTEQIEIAEYHHTKINPVYFGISKKSSLMYRVKEIEAEMKRMVENKEIDRIIVNYYRSRNIPVPEYK